MLLAEIQTGLFLNQSDTHIFKRRRRKPDSNR